jgi:hypothetical protein
MSYAVEALSNALEPGLFELWRANLPVYGDLSRKLEWTYRAPPAGPSDALVVVHREAGSADSVIGCSGLQPREFHCAAGMVRVGLNMDFAVDRRHRSGMPAIMLQRQMVRRARAAYPVSYGFPNDKALAIFERLGYHKLGELVRYSRVLHYERFVRRVVDLRGATRAAGLVLDAVAAAGRAPRLWPARRAGEVERLDRFDERFDELWRRAQGAWPFVGRRDARQLTWRYRARPGVPLRILAVRERRGGTALLGYAVVERIGDHAHLRDVFAGAAPALQPVLELVAAALRDEGVDSASLSFLGAPQVVGHFVACHFHRREVSRTVIVDVGEQAPMPSAVLHDPAAWYLTDADEDT